MENFKLIRKTTGIRQILFAILTIGLLTACQTSPKWAPYDGGSDSLYPGQQWHKAATPEQLGWSSEKLAEARVYSKQIGSSAVMIVDDGVVVDAWGEITRRFQCHSMRKSLLSALIGVHVDEGNIDLSKSLDDLGIGRIEHSLTAALLRTARTAGALAPGFYPGAVLLQRHYRRKFSHVGSLCMTTLRATRRAVSSGTSPTTVSI